MAVEKSSVEERAANEEKDEQDSLKTATTNSSNILQKHANKLSHKQWRRLWKKEKRRKLRQQTAKRFQILEEEELVKNGLTTCDALEAKKKQDEWQEYLEEKRRQKLHDDWLVREKLAQEEFDRQKKEEERRKQERIDQEKRIKEEWEKQQRFEKEMKEQKEQNVKNRENKLTKVLEKSGIIKSATEEGEWHNPIAEGTPENSKLYGTEQDPNNCSFFLKTGACRFGERCSRHHPKPDASKTLLIPNMFQDVRLTEAMLDEKDQDVGLEFDEQELYHNFKEFYKDVVSEFKSIGELYQFKVCSNFEPHLRGNVYVQYKREEDALKAFATFNGRWYAGRQLSVQLSPVTKWKSAICGTFARNRCPRGKNCNFLHVFRNPKSEFFEADRDLEPEKDRQPSTRRSDREWRSSTREMERRWERADSRYSERSSYRRERRSRRQSRSRSPERYGSRPRERYRSRSRSDSRERSVSKSISGRRRQRSRSPERRSRSPQRLRRSKSRDKSTQKNRSRSPSITMGQEKRQKHKRRRRSFSDSNSDEDNASNIKSRNRSRKSKHTKSKMRESDSDNGNFEPESDSD